MALRVISHTPTINATGVYLNESIAITFDKRLNTNTIDYTTLSLNDHNTFVSVPGTYSVEYCRESGLLSGYATTAVFTPTANLTPNTKYDVYVYGNPDSILSYEDEYLETTYSFSFTTGVEIWDAPGGSGALPSGTDPGWTGVLYEIPPSVTGNIDSFYVYSTTPKHQTPNINTTGTTELQIVFTGILETSLSELSGYISIEETPVLT